VAPARAWIPSYHLQASFSCHLVGAESTGRMAHDSYSCDETSASYQGRSVRPVAVCPLTGMERHSLPVCGNSVSNY
jgi:hypothetical protein